MMRSCLRNGWAVVLLLALGASCGGGGAKGLADGVASDAEVGGPDADLRGADSRSDADRGETGTGDLPSDGAVKDSTPADWLAQCGPSGLTAFTGAGVIPVCQDGVASDDTLLASHTVVVDGDHLCAVFPDGAAALPADTVVVDASGRYLIPGLADMHVHLGFPSDLVLYLANGVTTIRNMWGSPWHLTARFDLAAGTIPGPALYTTGPLMDGDPPYWPGSEVVTTAAEATASVQAQIEAGYDFIKVYGHLSPEAYGAILEAAGPPGIPVVGHPPESMPFGEVLASGIKSIEHLLGYSLDGSDGALEALTVEQKVWNCPTVVVWDRYSRVAEFQANPPSWLKYCHPAQIDSWMTASAYVEAPTPVVQAKLQQLHDLGALLMAGTDASNPFVGAGFSLHDELELMVGAGLSTAEVLRMATWAPAQFLGTQAEAGCIQPGMRADLVLLRANPLEDITVTRSIDGVMRQGKWYPAVTLQQMLDEVAAGYEADFGLSFDCGMPEDYLDPPAEDHAVFKGAGILTSFSDGDGYAGHKIDLVINGEPMTEPIFTAMVTLDLGAAGETVSFSAFTPYESLSNDLITYKYFSASIPRSVAYQSLKAGNPLIPAGAARVMVAQMDLKTTATDSLVRMCPIAVTAPGSESSFYLCSADNTSFALGEPLRLSGRHILTSDSQTIQDTLGMDAPCTCWNSSQQILPCEDF